MPSGSTLLLVEDQPEIRELVGEFLRDEGYTVCEASDGAVAIRFLNQEPAPCERYCGLSLDMMLPFVDGLEILGHLHELGDSIPVVAMSASAAHLQRAQAAGAQ